MREVFFFIRYRLLTSYLYSFYALNPFQFPTIRGRATGPHLNNTRWRNWKEGGGGERVRVQVLCIGVRGCVVLYVCMWVCIWTADAGKQGNGCNL